MGWTVYFKVSFIIIMPSLDSNCENVSAFKHNTGDVVVKILILE